MLVKAATGVQHDMSRSRVLHDLFMTVADLMPFHHYNIISFNRNHCVWNLLGRCYNRLLSICWSSSSLTILLCSILIHFAMWPSWYIQWQQLDMAGSITSDKLMGSGNLSRTSIPMQYFRLVGFVKYRQVSNTRRTLVGNKLVDHSDVVGASPVGAAPTTSSFFT